MCVADFDVCNPNPCQNGGTCITSWLPDDFICACQKHCNGTNCENCAMGKFFFKNLQNYNFWQRYSFFQYMFWTLNEEFLSL